MDKRTLWSRIPCVAGVAVSVLGGRLFFGGELRRGSMSELCLLSGSGLVALSAFLGKTRHRTFVYGALGLAVISVSAWIAYSVWLTTHHSYSVPWITQYPLPLIYWLGLWASLTGAMLVLFASPCASMPALGDVSISRCRWWWSRTVSLVGLAVLAIGIVTQFLPRLLPTWYIFLLILLGSGLVALGAYLGKSRYRTFLYGALELTGCVPITLILIISPLYFEGFPRWWEIVVWTYPIGLIMSCVGAVLVIRESFRGRRVSDDSVETA